MSAVPFPTTTISMIIALAVALAIWVSISAAHAARRRSLGVRVGVAMAAWLGFTLYLSHTDFIFSSTNPAYSLVFPLFISILGGAVLLSRAKFRQLVAATPQTMLIAPHMLRVIGFNFVILAELGYLPMGFALPAGYGDVVTGLTAPLVLYLIISKHSRSRQAIIGWNILGLADFIGAFIVGPTLIPDYLATFQQPYALNYFTMIPIFVVPIYVLTHLYSLVTVVTEQPVKAAVTPVTVGG